MTCESNALTCCMHGNYEFSILLLQFVCLTMQVNSELSHTRHVSPRNILRQAAFLGQPQALPPPGWNASISSHSSRHLPEHTAQLMTPTAVEPQLATAASTSATAVDNMPTSISRNTGVVCKAVGLGKVQVPSLSLAAVRAVRHTHGLHASHSKVRWHQLHSIHHISDALSFATLYTPIALDMGACHCWFVIRQTIQSWPLMLNNVLGLHTVSMPQAACVT